MNLHGIVSGAIGTVNPFVTVSVNRSSGYTTSPDGTRVPTYTTITGVSVQVQSLTFADLRQLDSLNIQGTKRAIYVGQQIQGIVRASQEGGDVLTFPNGTLPEGNTWLAVQVLENWADWQKIAITLQNGA